MIRSILKREKNLTEGPILSKVISLAAPLMVVAILNSTQSLIDIFWVGKLGSPSIAAVAISGTIMMVLIAMIMGVSTGTIALVARYVGAKDIKNADAVASQSTTLAIIIAFITAIIGLSYADKMFVILGAGPEVLKVGTGYLKILFSGAVTMFILFVGNSVLQGEGDTVTPMKLMVLANVINIILDPVFIFGLGVPRMNTSGAAVATVLAQAVSAFLVLSLLYKRKSRVHIHISQCKIKPSFLKEILKIGLPSSIQMFFRSIMSIALIGIVASFGTAAVAAYGVGMRIRMVVLMPAFAFGGAAATLVGQNLGVKQPKRASKSAWLATTIDMAIMVFLSILLFVFAPHIMKAFDKNPQVISLGAHFIKVTAPFYIFIALGVVFSRALAGAGDTLIPMIITLLTLWGFQIPAAVYMSKHTALGVSGVWWAVALASTIQGLLMTAWFQTGKWKKRVIPDTL
jgi:putative MATE family efflux protein